MAAKKPKLDGENKRFLTEWTTNIILRWLIGLKLFPIALYTIKLWLSIKVAI